MVPVKSKHTNPQNQNTPDAMTNSFTLNNQQQLTSGVFLFVCGVVVEKQNVGLGQLVGVEVTKDIEVSKVV